MDKFRIIQTKVLSCKIFYYQNLENVFTILFLLYEIVFARKINLFILKTKSWKLFWYKKLHQSFENHLWYCMSLISCVLLRMPTFEDLSENGHFQGSLNLQKSAAGKIERNTHFWNMYKTLLYVPIMCVKNRQNTSAKIIENVKWKTFSHFWRLCWHFWRFFWGYFVTFEDFSSLLKIFRHFWRFFWSEDFFWEWKTFSLLKIFCHFPDFWHFVIIVRHIDIIQNQGKTHYFILSGSPNCNIPHILQ